MSFWISGTMAVVSAYGAYSMDKAGNEQADRESRKAKQRYAIKTGIAENQMEEQNMLALEKMTDVTRKFLIAKGTGKAVQAETMVGGNLQKIKERDLRIKESETKGKVAKEIDINVINIAQGMIAEKIDTDALVAEALAKKKSGLQMLTNASLAGMKGYSVGSSFAKSLSSAPSVASGGTPVKTWHRPTHSDVGF